MATPRRADRVAREVQKELSELLRREVKDPRVRDATVSRVEMTDDLRNATVYVAALGAVGDEARSAELLAGLRAASGFLQGKVGRNLKLRSTPRLTFAYDAGLENLIHVAELLSGLEDEG
jgi:ribosome-binding factor A